MKVGYHHRRCSPFSYHSFLLLLSCHGIIFIISLTKAFSLVPPIIISQKLARTQTFLNANNNNKNNNNDKNTNNNNNILDCDVAIFGGGFGGLYTALSIAKQQQQQQKNKKKKKKKRLNVILVDPSSQFVFLPLLYDLTVGTATESEVCPYYSDIFSELPTSSSDCIIRHVQASLLNVDIYNNQASIQFANNNIDNDTTTCNVNFRAAVMAVGATPQSILKSVPGALQNVQPFYTAKNARQTRMLLERLEKQNDNNNNNNNNPSRVAIIGGGFGGVELAASIKRRLKIKQKNATVTLFSRNNAPMAGTRAENLVNQALKKLNIQVEICTVKEIQSVPIVINGKRQTDQYKIIRQQQDDDGDNNNNNNDNELWDAILWTAGSAPADPVPNGIDGLQSTNTKRLAIDDTLRCIGTKENDRTQQPMIWGIGDCAEIISTTPSKPAVPRTAQAAMQQADVVAYNVINELSSDKKQQQKLFEFNDLGSMLTLGGPNAALMAPVEGTPLAPIFGPLLNTVGSVLQTADKVIVNSVPSDMKLTSSSLGLSLGGYGISGGAEDDDNDDDENTDKNNQDGTLAGTLTGAARRVIYAARMPTNKQRVVAVTSAAFSTALTLAKEANSVLGSSSRNNNDNNKNNDNNEK